MNESDCKQLLKDVDIIILTPDKARVFLASQRENRRMKNANEAKLVNDMASDRFIYNGDPLRFDRHGRMGDGQHRCEACIKTGLEFPVLVVRNLPDEAFQTIDIGATRTAADIFTFEGIQNATIVTSSIRFYLALCNDGSGINDKGNGSLGVQAKNCKNTFSNAQILEEYNKNKDLWNEVASKANVMCERKLLTSSNIGGLLFYLIKEKNHPEERVYTFMKQLNGKRDSEYDIINQMRDILIENKNRKDNKKRYSGSKLMGLLAKAWNTYVSGRELKQLRYNKDIEGYIAFI